MRRPEKVSALLRRSRVLLRQLRRWFDQRRLLHFHAGFIAPGDLCFDVGANVGNRTELFLRLGAGVVCIEPQPACITALEQRYGNDPRVTVVTAGVGPEPGRAHLELADSTTLATLAPHWKEGRFCNQKWKGSTEIEVTTLDTLIETFGRPAFCKIDVEGFEFPALQGLSQPVPLISFEFTDEFLGEAMKCIDHLAHLGMTRFNYSVGEEGRFAHASWTGAETIKEHLTRHSVEGLWGDVYARSTPGTPEEGRP